MLKSRVLLLSEEVHHPSSWPTHPALSNAKRGLWLMGFPIWSERSRSRSVAQLMGTHAGVTTFPRKEKLVAFISLEATQAAPTNRLKTCAGKKHNVNVKWLSVLGKREIWTRLPENQTFFLLSYTRNTEWLKPDLNLQVWETKLWPFVFWILDLPTCRVSLSSCSFAHALILIIHLLSPLILHDISLYFCRKKNVLLNS